ncbi:hypothetical protein [Aestuariivirga sp.]|uniref:hypothetical protein n=1 Tax=Aestuariivirga sp. TaxID=2650926 RepID=UPI0035940214
MSILSAVKGFFAAQHIRDAAGLRQFMESRSAYLVQKSITEYIQARANVLFSTLMREKLFIEGYERARWLSYPAAISMVAEMVEGTLREQAGTAPGQLDAALCRIVEAILGQYAGPSGQGEKFWQDAAERVARDLAQAALAAPKQVHAIPYSRAREIFEALPVAEQIRKHDFAMFQNTIRFHLTEITSEFDERVEAAALAESLAS